MFFDNIFEMIFAAIALFILASGVIVAMMGLFIMYIMFKPFSDILLAICVLIVLYIKINDNF